MSGRFMRPVPPHVYDPHGRTTRYSESRRTTTQRSMLKHAPCPCGSGRKVGKCHGQRWARDWISRNKR